VPSVVKVAEIRRPLFEVVQGVLEFSVAPIHDPTVIVWGSVGDCRVPPGGQRHGSSEWVVAQSATLHSIAGPLFAQGVHRFVEVDGVTEYTCEVYWKPTGGAIGPMADWLLERLLPRHICGPIQWLKLQLEGGADSTSDLLVVGEPIVVD